VTPTDRLTHACGLAVALLRRHPSRLARELESAVADVLTDLHDADGDRPAVRLTGRAVRLAGAGQAA